MLDYAWQVVLSAFLEDKRIGKIKNKKSEVMS